MCPNLSLVGFPAKWQEEFVYTRSWRLKGKVCLFCNMFRSLSYRCQASSEWYNMWKSTRSKTKSESELSESESELSWLLICSAPSCWNWHPPLLFTLFSLKAIGGHKPHYWCLVEFGSAVQNKVCLAGCDSYCFINLPFKAAMKASNHFHCEDLLLTIVLKLAVFPKWRILSFISQAFKVLQPSRVCIPCTLAFILSFLSSQKAALANNSVTHRVCFTASFIPWRGATAVTPSTVFVSQQFVATWAQ